MNVLEVYLTFFVILICAFVSESCHKEFMSSGLVPNFIPKAPKQKIMIKYGDLSVDCGQKVPQHLTSNPPEINFPGNENDLYTLIMIDPDVPTPFNHSLAFFRHWIVVNIPGSKVDDGFVNTDYLQPVPEEGGDLTDYHRYTFLAYKQNKSEPKEKFSGSRANFNLMDYVTSHQLNSPVAGNFMRVRPET